MGHFGSRRALWGDHPGAWGRSLDRLSSRGPPAAFLGRREFDVGRLYRRNDAGGMLHGDRDVSCDADDKGDSPADRHAWLAAARHEPTVVEAVAYHDCRDICVHIVTLRARDGIVRTRRRPRPKPLSAASGTRTRREPLDLRWAHRVP